MVCSTMLHPIVDASMLPMALPTLFFCSLQVIAGNNASTPAAINRDLPPRLGCWDTRPSAIRHGTCLTVATCVTTCHRYSCL